jgi:hypothetical protein
MSYDAKRWYIARCSCTKPILYQDLDRYPLRCARCGGHLYTEPRPPHFERLTHTPDCGFPSRPCACWVGACWGCSLYRALHLLHRAGRLAW